MVILMNCWRLSEDQRESEKLEGTQAQGATTLFWVYPQGSLQVFMARIAERPPGVSGRGRGRQTTVKQTQSLSQNKGLFSRGEDLARCNSEALSHPGEEVPPFSGPLQPSCLTKVGGETIVNRTRLRGDRLGMLRLGREWGAGAEGKTTSPEKPS